MQRMLLVAVFTLVALPSLVRADAIGLPPASCPAGSTPRSSHAGPTCEPVPMCAPMGICPGGSTCVPIRQCIEQRDCGGRRPPDSGPCFVQNVTGLCGSDGSCATGTCMTREVCPGSAGVGEGCSCRVAPRGVDLASVLAMGAAVLGMVARRMRRRARAV